MKITLKEIRELEAKAIKTATDQIMKDYPNPNDFLNYLANASKETAWNKYENILLAQVQTWTPEQLQYTTTLFLLDIIKTELKTPSKKHRTQSSC